MKLRTRLLTWFVTLTALAGLLLSGFVFVAFRSYVLRSTEADLAARATAIAESVSDWLERGDLDRVHVLVDRYGAQEDLWLRVYDPDGRLIASSSAADDLRVSDWRHVPGMAEAFAGRASHGIAQGVLAADARIYQALPLARRGRRLGALRLSRTLAPFDAAMTHTAAMLAGALLAILALCALLSARAASAIAGPVQRMRDFAVAVGNGRFDERLPRGESGEIGELSDALNEMCARLAQLDEERRSFLANASHELRTPVTNVHATLEALSSGADEDPVIRAQFVRTALSETQRMTHLVEALLDLGRLEAGVGEIERRPVEVDRIVQRAVAPLRPRFDADGVTLTTSLAPAWTDGDPERLVRALLNVLDNALKYSPRGAGVDVVVDASGDFTSIEVLDRGPGFAEADLPRVFEQFYTRGHAGAKAGNGLGLAIAKRIVEAHGGSVTACNRDGGGARVSIRLPRRESLPAVAATAA